MCKHLLNLLQATTDPRDAPANVIWLLSIGKAKSEKSSASFADLKLAMFLRCSLEAVPAAPRAHVHESPAMRFGRNSNSKQCCSSNCLQRIYRFRCHPSPDAFFMQLGHAMVCQTILIASYSFTCNLGTCSLDPATMLAAL